MSLSTPLYTPLLEGEFRLLRIAQSGSPLSITLETFELISEPGYSALSYTWGLQEDGQAEILCNGTKITIWINLFHALHRLRDSLEDGSWVWIDALCINQADFAEKAVQIPLMGTIYSQALEVLVWLGLATEEEEAALEKMSDIGGELGNIKDGTGDMSVQIEWAYKIIPGEDSSLWSHFWRLILRPWWNRIWTTQEIVLTTSCTMLLGSEAAITFDAFIYLIGSVNLIQYHRKGYVRGHQDWIHDSDDSFRREARSRLVTHQGLKLEDLDDPQALESRFIENATGILHKVRIVRTLQLMLSGDELEGNEAGMEEHTHQMLQAFSGRGCAMDHDRVYAMLGIMIPRLKQGIKVDMSKTPEEIFIDTSIHWLEQDPHLSFLHWIKPYSTVSDFPSWCLDFRRLQGVTILYFSSLFVDDSNSYSAGLHRHTNSHVTTARRSAQGKEATIEGIHVDTIVAKVEPSGLHRKDWQSLLSDEGLRDHRNKAICWLEMCEQLAGINDDPQRFETYWRTLVLNAFGMESMDYGATDKHGKIDRSAYYREMLGVLRRESLDSRISYSDGARTFLDNIAHVSDMDFFVTADGRLGRSEHGANIGDEVVIFHGARTPFLLRPVGADRYRFRGETYVHKIMYGEALDSTEGADTRNYKIV